MGYRPHATFLVSRARPASPAEIRGPCRTNRQDYVAVAPFTTSNAIRASLSYVPRTTNPQGGPACPPLRRDNAHYGPQAESILSPLGGNSRRPERGLLDRRWGVGGQTGYLVGDRNQVHHARWRAAYLPRATGHKPRAAVSSFQPSEPTDSGELESRPARSLSLLGVLGNHSGEATPQRRHLTRSWTQLSLG